MTTLDRRALVAGAGLAALAIPASAQADGKPPVVAAPADAKSITVTLRLTAKDPAAFKAHLLKVIPVTRIASGCRYSHSYQAPQRPAEFVLIQGWDSLTQQQAYIGWRDRIGDLKQFIDFLAKPPVVEVFELFDA